MMAANWRVFRSPLSAREAELAELAARGYPSKEIASRLLVSPDTVKTHLRNIFRKCKVRNRAELAAWWWGNGHCATEPRARADSDDFAQSMAKAHQSKLSVTLTRLAVMMLVMAVVVSLSASGPLGVRTVYVPRSIDVGATYSSDDCREVVEEADPACQQVCLGVETGDLQICPTRSVPQ